MTQEEFNIEFMKALCHFTRFRFLSDDGTAELTTPLDRLEFVIGVGDNETWHFEYQLGIDCDIFYINENWFDDFLSLYDLDYNTAIDWVRDLLVTLFGVSENIDIDIL